MQVNCFINGYDCGIAEINFGVPQGSVLETLLLLLQINDFNEAIKICKVHHFADDTNLLYLSKFIKKLNKLVKLDLKNLAWGPCIGYAPAVQLHQIVPNRR